MLEQKQNRYSEAFDYIRYFFYKYVDKHQNKILQNLITNYLIMWIKLFFVNLL